MQRYFKYILLLILVIFIAACTNTLQYNKDEVAAVVKGKEITIGDLRFLYPDDQVMEMIDGTVKLTLAVQEAKEMRLDVAEEIKQYDEMMGELPPENAQNPTSNSIREFAEKQAKKLGMAPEEFHEKYIKITSEQSAYVNAYIGEMLGEPDGDEEAIEEYNDRANQLLDELVKENENEIEILIK